MRSKQTGTITFDRAPCACTPEVRHIQLFVSTDELKLLRLLGGEHVHVQDCPARCLTWRSTLLCQ